MKIIVCCKVVPNEEELQVLPSRELGFQGVPWKISQYDLNALESGKQLAKQCGKEEEQAKISVRNARRDTIDRLKKAIKDGLAEDAEKDGEAKLQKVHDKYIRMIDELLAAKTKEIMTV